MLWALICYFIYATSCFQLSIFFFFVYVFRLENLWNNFLGVYSTLSVWYLVDNWSLWKTLEYLIVVLLAMVQSWKISFSHLGKYFICWRSFPGNLLKYVNSAVEFKGICENFLKWVRRLWQTLKRVKNCVHFDMYFFLPWNTQCLESGIVSFHFFALFDHSNAYLFYFWKR